MKDIIDEYNIMGPKHDERDSNKEIAIIDADLIGRRNHRFPNLACMKIASYYKSLGYCVNLVTDYNTIGEYDEVFISKVFTDTPVPPWIEDSDKIHLGGTGFCFDKAKPLPTEIEHFMPDYNLYDRWIMKQVESEMRSGKDEATAYKKFRGYTDYSIGFLTRGCFRHCKFCVNQNLNRSVRHSPLSEFLDMDRPKICLLDDNFFACRDWEPMLRDLIQTGKAFTFKQGLDERLLDDKKAELLFSAKYDGEYTFAFDRIADYNTIKEKLKIIRAHTKKRNIKFYVLCGFEGTGLEDIENTFKRISLLCEYNCLPYVMRYQGPNEKPWDKSEFRGVYVQLARWCNQPAFFTKKSFAEYCMTSKAGERAWATLVDAGGGVAERYGDLRFGGGK